MTDTMTTERPEFSPGQIWRTTDPRDGSSVFVMTTTATSVQADVAVLNDEIQRDVGFRIYAEDGARNAFVADSIADLARQALSARPSAPVVTEEVVEAVMTKFVAGWSARVARFKDFPPGIVDLNEERDAMRAALEAALSASPAPNADGAAQADAGWRPIETVPEGIQAAFLGYADPTGGRWAEYGIRARPDQAASSGIHWLDVNGGDLHPTHWMPLPTSPGSETEEERAARELENATVEDLMAGIDFTPAQDSEEPRAPSPDEGEMVTVRVPVKLTRDGQLIVRDIYKTWHIVFREVPRDLTAEEKHFLLETDPTFRQPISDHLIRVDLLRPSDPPITETTATVETAGGGEA